MDAKTFAASFRSSSSPLFSALRRLADAPPATVAEAALDGGWIVWDGAQVRETIVDGSPA